MKHVFGFLLAALLAAGTAQAGVDDWRGRAWQPYSSIAIYITGQIQTNEDAIVFANTEQLPVRVWQDEVPGKWGFGDEEGKATVLEITEPGVNPKLIEDNTICGKPPTFIALYVDPRGGLVLSAYWSEEPPTSAKGDGLCAMYDYGRMP